MEGESCSWPGLWKHGEVERHSGWVARCCKPPRYPCGVTVQEDFIITVHNRDANTLWNPEYVLISGRWVNEGGDKGHLIMLSWGDWKVWMCSKSTSLAQSSTLMNCCNKVAPNWSECRPRLVVLLDCMFHPFSFGSSLWDWRTFNDNLLSVWAASSLCLEPTSVQDACLALMNCCFSVCSLKWHCFLKHPYFLVLLKKIMFPAIFQVFISSLNKLKVYISSTGFIYITQLSHHFTLGTNRMTALIDLFKLIDRLCNMWSALNHSHLF